MLQPTVHDPEIKSAFNIYGNFYNYKRWNKIGQVQFNTNCYFSGLITLSWAIFGSRKDKHS